MDTLLFASLLRMEELKHTHTHHCQGSNWRVLRADPSMRESRAHTAVAAILCIFSCLYFVLGSFFSSGSDLRMGVTENNALLAKGYPASLPD